MVEIVAAGGIIVDNVVAADGLVVREQIGGNAVYAAAGARLWRRRGEVGIVGVIPSDYPDAFVAALRETGIDTGGIHRTDEPAPASEWFFHRPDGSRADHLHAIPGAFEAFGLRGERVSEREARDFEAFLRSAPPPERTFKTFRALNPVRPTHVPDRYRSARAFHCGPNRADAQVELARAAKAQGAFVSLDPGFAAPQLGERGLSEALSAADAFLPSEKELRQLRPTLQTADAIASLADLGARIVVAKLGARGALLLERGGRPTPVPAVPLAEAPDPTGAGDAFAGGFLAGMIATGDPFVSGCMGAVSASLAVEAFGPWRLLVAERGQALERLDRLASTVEGPARARLLSFLNALEP